MNGTTTGPAATERQVEYIKSLLDGRVMPDESRAAAKAQLEAGLTKFLASRWIDKLLTLPKIETNQYYGAGGPGKNDPIVRVEYREVETEEVDEDGNLVVRKIGYLTGLPNVIPRGSYALVQDPPTKSGNDITFYKLWIGDRYGWRLSLCHGPDETPMSRKAALTILAQIAENPGEAAMRFGLNIKKCGVCGRRLTNKDSRALGIGPICRERWGW